MSAGRMEGKGVELLPGGMKTGSVCVCVKDEAMGERRRTRETRGGEGERRMEETVERGCGRVAVFVRVKIVRDIVVAMGR